MCCTLGIAVLAGCDRGTVTENQYSNVSLPEFSSDNLHALLEKLLVAYESKGMNVSASLLPPIPESDLLKKCHWFPGELPPEIISLYSWRGGQEKDAWESDFPFWFRDNSFCSIERAEHEYASMMRSYGLIPEYRSFLKYCFPFASFNGGWYVLPTKGQPFSRNLKAPIISVLEGVDIFYFSIETMVATCIDWVIHQSYDANYSLPSDIEMNIWRKHNPGIFK